MARLYGKKSGYRLGRHLKSSRRDLRDYITYLQTTGRPGDGGGEDGDAVSRSYALAWAINTSDVAARNFTFGWNIESIEPLPAVETEREIGWNIDNVYDGIENFYDFGWKLDQIETAEFDTGWKIAADAKIEPRIGWYVQPIETNEFDMGWKIAADIGTDFLTGWEIIQELQPEPETTAYVNAMSVTPSSERQIVINDFIKAVKDAGIWNKIDVLALHAAHDEQAARINAIDPTEIAEKIQEGHRPYYFTVDRGFKAIDGGENCGLRWPGLPANRKSNMNSIAIAIVSIEATTQAFGRDWGYDGNYQGWIKANNSFFGRVATSSGGVNFSASQTPAIGLCGVSRIGSDLRGYFGNIEIASVTETPTHAVNASGRFYTSRINIDKSSSGRRACGTLLSEGLTGAEWTALNDAFMNYLDAVGALEAG